MSSGVVLILIVFLAVGCMVGWHAQRAKMAHGDIKVGKGRVSGGRNVRMRSGLFVIVLVGIAVLVMAALIRGGH
jgi:hypothetical protein